MQLKSIQLTNFRNHTQTFLQFKARLIFFIGNNGEGKTNILEAISLLSHLKSFRESSEEELWKWDSPHTYIKAQYEAKEEDYLFEYGIELKPFKRKRIKLNQEVIKKQSDIFGIFKCVVFSPPDLQIIDFGHEERRKFIDSFISSLDKDYLLSLLDYNKILKQRNAALKNKVPQKEVQLWEPPLIDHAQTIISKRTEFIQELNQYFEKNISALSHGKDTFQLSYDPNVKNSFDFQEKLERNWLRDSALGYTSSGIHRDKIPIGYLERDLGNFGSQGQKRSAVIALKAGTFQMVTEKTNEKPVVLIDDIIRELDVKRREYFVDLISRCGQVFFTTTDLEGMQEYLGNLPVEKEIYEVQNGIVTRVTLS